MGSNFGWGGKGPNRIGAPDPNANMTWKDWLLCGVVIFAIGCGAVWFLLSQAGLI